MWVAIASPEISLEKQKHQRSNFNGPLHIQTFVFDVFDAYTPIQMTNRSLPCEDWTITDMHTLDQYLLVTPSGEWQRISKQAVQRLFSLYVQGVLFR